MQSGGKIRLTGARAGSGRPPAHRRLTDDQIRRKYEATLGHAQPGAQTRAHRAALTGPPGGDYILSGSIRPAPSSSPV